MRKRSERPSTSRSASSKSNSTGSKKTLDCSVEAKRQLRELGHPRISVRRPCALLGLSRARLYDEPRRESAENLWWMRLLDEQYACTPYDDIRRMMTWLRTQGYQVNHKRVQRPLRLMGLEAIDQKPRLSQLGAGQQVSPYLLQEVPIARVNQVWSTDTTYIRLLHGFVYLMALLDWLSRYVVAWEVSVTRDRDFCFSALERALVHAQPEIFNSDQGAQFTRAAFTERLKARGIHLSMDGRGRALDHIFVKRLWRTVTSEEVYLHDYRRVSDASCHLGRYVTLYHRERLHQALNDQTPEAVSWQRARAKDGRVPPSTSRFLVLNLGYSFGVNSELGRLSSMRTPRGIKNRGFQQPAGPFDWVESFMGGRSRALWRLDRGRSGGPGRGSQGQAPRSSRRG